MLLFFVISSILVLMWPGKVSMYLLNTHVLLDDVLCSREHPGMSPMTLLEVWGLVIPSPSLAIFTSMSKSHWSCDCSFACPPQRTLRTTTTDSLEEICLANSPGYRCFIRMTRHMECPPLDFLLEVGCPPFLRKLVIVGLHFLLSILVSHSFLTVKPNAWQYGWA